MPDRSLRGVGYIEDDCRRVLSGMKHGMALLLVIGVLGFEN